MHVTSPREVKACRTLDPAWILAMQAGDTDRGGDGGPGTMAGRAGDWRPPGTPVLRSLAAEGGVWPTALTQQLPSRGALWDANSPPSTLQLCFVLKSNPGVGRKALCALCLPVLPEQALFARVQASPGTSTAGLKVPPYLNV